MNKAQINIVKRVFPVAISMLATIASISIFLGAFKSFVSYELILGVFGTAVGVTIAILFIRLKEATNSPKIFISYSHKDLEFVEKLYKELSQTSFTVLMDKHEIHVGDNIKDKVEELMNNSDYLIYVSSNNSSSSDWASVEIEKAKKLNKKILPLVIDDSEVPVFVKDIMYADFSKSFNNGMDELVKTLRLKRHNKANQH